MTTTSSSTDGCRFGEGFDFTDPDVMVNGVPHDQFAELRSTMPVWWNGQPREGNVFSDAGYWAVTKHAHIREISKNNHAWSTYRKGAVMRLPDGITAEQLDLTRALLINHDVPEHTRLRKIISRLFTPRAISSLTEILRESARRIAMEAASKTDGDFVADVAIHLPLQAILDLVGFPAEDHARIFTLANAMINTHDQTPDLTPEMANAELLGYAYLLAEERRKHPTDDILTTLVQADIDGEALSEAEFGFFIVLLVIAGNETTRNATTHGMNAFLDNPDQWELYKAQRPATAVDEIIRWATPVHCFQRTALVDTEIGGVPIESGDRVGLFYSSANFDEDVFNDPFTFDILRDPNPHLSFGGSGAHFCVGANLARLEVGLMFDAIADVLPDITKVAEPQRLRAGWLNGAKEFDVRYR
ncbi:cytochrome P450 [Gordonia sp. TBRC 11910]|uniref:Cytochrome P450 n=1 Tax=Gordonia asplenii TaxID=2725283 RepID=A0A848L213_9ACTN|nr:cytochrome P450 [Gordonia asplenii]NMO04769.1 cytochrome P450 [Gordonia asplenii]